jgi:hypothetical protein
VQAPPLGFSNSLLLEMADADATVDEGGGQNDILRSVRGLSGKVPNVVHAEIDFSAVDRIVQRNAAMHEIQLRLRCMSHDGRMFSNSDDSYVERCVCCAVGRGESSRSLPPSGVARLH